MAENIRRKIPVLVLAAVVLFTVWMLWPRSLAGAFDARGDLSVSVITSGVEVVDMTSKPWQDVETYTVEAGSPEAAAVEKSLQEYSYRLCWDSLTGKSLIEDIGAVSVKLYGPEGDLSVFSGTGKIRLNGRTVRLTGGRSADLCEKLRAAPLMSIRMGAGKRLDAHRILNNCFLMLCVCGVVLTAAVFPLREPMLRTFGASEVTYPYAETYFTAYLCGTVFNLLALGLNQFIICQGYAKRGMISVMLGAVLNIVMDPVFIFALDLGVVGAAVATVLSQMASCAYVLRFLFSKEVPVPITFGGYQLRRMGRILLTGLTPFLIVAVDNVMIITMNAVLQRYGGPELGDQMVTCATIAQSFMLVVTMPLGGISSGTQTILAFNYGARRRDRILQAQKHIVLMCVGYTALLFFLARAAGGLFVSLFTRSPDLAAEAMEAIRICTLAVVPLGLQYALVDGFTGMGLVQLSLPLSTFRKVTYFLALFWLPGAFGVRAVFYAEPISDILGPLASVVVYALCIRKILDFSENTPT